MSGHDTELEFDEIGYWSEIKLDILREYAQPYSTILSKRSDLEHVYIDGFAGSGINLSRRSGSLVPGSPLNALEIVPPFKKFYLIDMEGKRTAQLRGLVRDRPDVRVLEGDCNQVLLNEVFPEVRYEHFRRGLCVLDPYGLHLDWSVLLTAGRMRSIEIFLNFPSMAIHRSVLRRDLDRLREEAIRPMSRFWGDESWKASLYSREKTLFGEEPTKLANEAIAEVFRARLHDRAGFEFVPRPLAMRNSKGNVVYYLFFAGQNQVGNKIASDIFEKYRSPSGGA